MGCDGSSLREDDAADASQAPVASRPRGHACPVGTLDLGATALLQHALTSAPPLRVAIVLDEGPLTRWSAHLLDALAGADFLDLVRVRRDGGARRPPGRVGLAFAVYERLCRARYAELDPFAPSAAPGALAAIREIAPHELPTTGADVVLDLGSGPVSPDIARVARYGAWQYRYGAGPSSSPPCFDELARGAPLTHVRLHALAPCEDGGVESLVLAHGAFATTRTANVVANRIAPYWGAHHFALQKLRELHAHGWATVRDRAPRERTHDTSDAPQAATAVRLLRWSVREASRRLARRARLAPGLTDWCVAVRRADAPLAERPPDAAFEDSRYLPNPRGRFFADPFLVSSGARTWLFVEDFAFDRARGAISCGELLPDGTVHDLRPCLEREHHLSYPNVFWHEGAAWLVPESEQTGTVDLYRAVDFPWRWTRERTLLRLRCVDPTIVHHADRWWLFATHVPLAGVDATTLLWHAPSPLGPWKLHPRSPIVVDVRRARGAGRPFVHAGRLLRPAQDGARHYGRALVLNEVARLTPTEYEERPVRRYAAPARRGLDGLHHYSRSGAWEAFDVRMQSPLPRFEERPERDAAGRLTELTLEGGITPRR